MGYGLTKPGRISSEQAKRVLNDVDTELEHIFAREANDGGGRASQGAEGREEYLVGIGASDLIISTLSVCNQRVSPKMRTAKMGLTYPKSWELTVWSARTIVLAALMHRVLEVLLCRRYPL